MTRCISCNQTRQISHLIAESDSRLLCIPPDYQSAQCLLVVRSWCIPPVNTVPHGDEILVHRTNQHSASWWSDLGASHQSTQCLMVVRSWCIPPVNTVPHGDEILVHPTNQHSASWWSDLGASHQSTQCLMAVRSWCIPPVNTVPHGGQILVNTVPHGGQILANTVPHGGQILVHPTSQHRASWWSDLGASHQSAQSLMAVKPEACEEKGMA